jgi:hypothetical protein
MTSLASLAILRPPICAPALKLVPEIDDETAASDCGSGERQGCRRLTSFAKRSYINRAPETSPLATCSAPLLIILVISVIFGCIVRAAVRTWPVPGPWPAGARRRPVGRGHVNEVLSLWPRFDAPGQPQIQLRAQTIRPDSLDKPSQLRPNGMLLDCVVQASDSSTAGTVQRRDRCPSAIMAAQMSHPMAPSPVLCVDVRRAVSARGVRGNAWWR